MTAAERIRSLEAAGRILATIDPAKVDALARRLMAAPPDLYESLRRAAAIATLEVRS